MKKIFLVFACACLSAGNIIAQSKKPATATVWPQITKEMQPWTRWWWMGNAVDNKNTVHLLELYHKAGFGGVEVTPIYGAIGYENRYLQFLSPQWMSALDFTIQKAKALGMGVDMNTGTGWPFGGPQIKAGNAAGKLIIQTYKLAAGETLNSKIVVNDARQAKNAAVLQAVIAYGDKGEVLDITNKVSTDGSLNWKPAEGKWDIYAAFSGKTLQQVKRAAPGGEGFVMDHLSRIAVDTYLKRFDEAFKGKSPGIGSYFNDSYEVYGASWSPGFFDEFQRRRGYDLRLHLNELNSSENTEKVARVKIDYRETMSQMLLDNFTLTWTNWAHHYGSLTRNQSHGSPGNLLDLYGAVDIPECETFGSSHFDIPGLRRDSADVRNVDPDPMMLKFASSAGHVNGRRYATSETFTWLTEHFKGSLSQCKPELEQVFLAGVNHVYFHGTTYSPDDIAFPGWLFYASTNFVPNNSWWDHLPGLNNYIARCQSVLQAGKPDNELLIYWPVYDAWANTKGMEMQLAIHDINQWLRPTDFYKASMELQKAGYSFDFISDKQIGGSSVVNGQIVTKADAQSRKVLVVPACRFMPLGTLDKIIALAQAGATVIMQKLPEDVPGLANLEVRQSKLKSSLVALKFNDLPNGVKQCKTGTGQILLTADVQKALEYRDMKGEALVTTGLKFIRRSIAGGKYYFIVNHTPEAIDTDLPLNVKAVSVVIMDPQSGAYGLAKSSANGNTTNVHVQLQPGEAVILKANSTPVALIAKWKYIEKTDAPLTIGGNWALHFTKGGPVVPADQQLSDLKSWTALNDPNAVSFSGSGEYTTTFDLPVKKASDYILNLGKVCESAHVYINGQDAGIFWSIPFSARVGKYLKPGNNTIKVEIDNLMANHIRYMDQNGIQWRKYHEINFVNINYQPFDASKWSPMPSGLLGPVTLTPVE
ncbi:glycoside hydrolase [Mucilaginibacter sp. PPCGB 2223]|uniref:glycosyl hydrolase n=1 Tax=Mucilaginibacter sp. PPCGB 2223 TaxID=1886027 RepID=UPI00082613A6|nr:glycosyl hydrolase [Mucilaginibacter sp. PPCGB 2223]OCX51851.1 glycoside hydrolase [Mucilaginibacter sp. PPCGB 2223]